MIEFPDWTQFDGNSEHRGLDPLGLASVGGSIVQKKLLPGITNTTKHVRYYSFFCWVFWTFWQDKARKHSTLEQRKWIVRMENVLRTATLWKSPDIKGLVGVERALRIDGPAALTTVPIDEKGSASAFVPANYSSSFNALGCGQVTERHGMQATALGEQLAKAFDSMVRQSPGSRSALSAIISSQERVPAHAIKAVAADVQLRRVKPNEPEHRLLMELLFRLSDDPDRRNPELDHARSRSFALLMEMVEQSEGTVFSENDVHRILATADLPNRRRFAIPPEFRIDFEIWRRYEERQYVKLSLYALWHEVVQVLSSQSKSLNGVLLLSTIGGAFEKSAIATDWFGRGFTNKTLGAARQTLSRRFREKPHDFGRSAIEMAESLKNRECTSPEMVGTSMALLLLTCCYWQEMKTQLEAADLHREGGRERLSLDVISQDADQMEASTLSDYVQWITENYVLKQATRTAIDKLPDYRFFILRDDDGYRLVKSQNPGSYLAYDPTRIDSAFRLMADLELINLEDGYKLTATGRKELDKLRIHHRDRQN